MGAVRGYGVLVTAQPASALVAANPIANFRSIVQFLGRTPPRESRAKPLNASLTRGPLIRLAAQQRAVAARATGDVQR